MAAANRQHNLLTRAYRVAVLFWLVAMLVVLGSLNAALIGGLVAGFGVAMALLASWHYAVTVLMKPRGKQPAGLLVVGLIKLPVFGLLIYGLLTYSWCSPLGFVGGFSIVQLALLTVVVGSRLGSNAKEHSHVAAYR